MASHHPLACQHLPFQQALNPIDQYSPAGTYRQVLALKGETGAPCLWAKEGLHFLQHWLLRRCRGDLAWCWRPSTPSPSLPSWPRAHTRQAGLTMKEKPCIMEVPSTRKCLSSGMSVTLRLMLAGPAACAPTGSSSHSSSSTKPFQENGLEHQGTQGQPGSHRPGCMPTTYHKSSLSLRMVSLHPCLLLGQAESSTAGTNFAQTMTQEMGRAHAGSRKDRVVSLDTKAARAIAAWPPISRE